MTNGVYILGNDVVCDQMIALINSIEQNVDKELPICIVPYDDNTERSRAATQQYSQVQWFDDEALISKWESFSTNIWQAHPFAFQAWAERGMKGVGRMGMHRRFCCFDGPFEKFIYLDADILAMQSFDLLFDSLDDHDFVTYDFQYKDLSHVYDINAPNLTEVFGRDRLDTEIFCAGLFASKKGAFTDDMLADLLRDLQDGDAEILYHSGPDQSILNYMVMKSGIDAINLSRTLPAQDRTGCCVTSPHFEEKGRVLFDGDNQLIYLHYIGVGSRFFRRVCEGENILFPYRDLFLHYRYLYEETAPQLAGRSVYYKQADIDNRERVTRKTKQLVTAFKKAIQRKPKPVRPTLSPKALETQNINP